MAKADLLQSDLVTQRLRVQKIEVHLYLQRFLKRIVVIAPLEVLGEGICEHFVRMAMDLRVMQPLRFPLPSRTLAVCSEQCNSASSKLPVIGAGRRRRRNFVVRAAKPGGSVDTPDSSASTSTSSEAGILFFPCILCEVNLSILFLQLFEE